MIWRIARGSLRNKLLFILPAALILSQWFDWALTPLLMCGGTYLCYEGAEKVWERLRGHEEHAPVATEQGELGQEDERPDGGRRDPDRLHPLRRDHGDRAQRGGRRGVRVAGDHPRGRRRRHHRARVRRGRRDREDGRRRPGPEPALVGVLPAGRHRAGPRDAGLLNVISTVGVAAMLWVGGHIILVGLDDLGWHWLYDVVHHWEEDVHDALGAIGGVAGWLVNTVASAILGLVVGAVAARGDARAAVRPRGAESAAEPRATSPDGRCRGEQGSAATEASDGARSTRPRSARAAMDSELAASERRRGCRSSRG